MPRKPIKYLAALLLVLLFSSLIAVYVSQLKSPNTVNVWISNGRCSGLDKDNGTAGFVFANVVENESRAVFREEGLHKQMNVSETKFLSVCDGIMIWANDSLNAYRFPLVSDDDPYFTDSIYLSVKNIHTTVTAGGKSPVTVETFNPHGSIAEGKAYAYVDLDKTENMLNIKGNMSYTLSVTADTAVSVALPPFMGLSSNPDKLTQKQTMALGSIEITCENGVRQTAAIDFPYRTVSFAVQSPYLQTIS
jgi:hypothetical protein